MNENCNEILRRFIPKGTDLETISEYKLESILEKKWKAKKNIEFQISKRII